MIVPISNVLTNSMNLISKLNSKIDLNIEQTNKLIVNIKNITDKKSAIIKRNNTLVLINTAEQKVNTIQKILSSITKIISVFNVIIKILKLLPIPTAPFPIPLSLIMKFTEKMIQASKLIADLLIILSAFNGLVSLYKSLLEISKNKLKTIGDLLENPLLTSLSEENIIKIMESNPIKLGLLDETYNGFRFAIKTDQDPKTVIGNYNRHYAVAINSSDTEVLRSEYSYTLYENVLVEELKLIIDKENLQA